MDLGPHAGFIVTAYAVACVVVAGLIAWIVADHRAQTRSLEDLDRSGVTRRSSPRGEPT
jgi:heme exporter protein D